MADPRIQRTKNHVLAAAGRLLTENGARRLTYTRVAAEASVSRRTLYVYWPTIEYLIAEVFSQRELAETPGAEDSTSRQRMTRFLESVRAGLQDPIENAALIVTTRIAPARRFILFLDIGINYAGKTAPDYCWIEHLPE